MKKLLLVLLILSIMTSITLGLDQEAHKRLLQFRIIADLGRFMEMSEITLKKTGLEPGRLAGLAYKTNFLMQWNVMQAIYNDFQVYLILTRTEALEKDLSDQEFDRLLKDLKKQLPRDWDTWKEARDKLVRYYIAGLEDIDITISKKDAEGFVDASMLFNVERFRDSKGKLHIPDFLLEKYKN